VIRRWLCVALLLPASSGLASEARRLVPWLDVPAAWARRVENGIVAVRPGDLPAGRTLVLLVEPASTSKETPQAAYERALRELGPWEPIGEPIEQQGGGWTFRQGVGVVTLESGRFIGNTIVARRGDRLVRLWALADSDATFNLYKPAIGTAIASVQDLAEPAGPDGPAPEGRPRAAASATAARPPAGFGQGLSGVYVGLDRGVSAGAATGNQVASRIGDAEEVDVLFPDGSYRRRLPIRGLASDLAWERRQQPNLWGRWTQQGRQVVVRRGGYTATYTIDGQGLVSDRGRPWVKLALHRGTRLDATFARADYREAGAPRLTLRADGSYEDRGGFLRMIGSAWHLVVPDADAMRGRWNDAQFDRAMAASSGTYTFDDFTLTLRTSDGRTWQVNAYVPVGEAAPRPRRLVVNGRVLARD